MCLEKLKNRFLNKEKRLLKVQYKTSADGELYKRTRKIKLVVIKKFFSFLGFSALTLYLAKSLKNFGGR